MARNKATEGKLAESGLAGLCSSKSLQRLKNIASLRARGIGDTIDLPQLVVTGDQSAGKSSVLEGLTGIPFPRDDGVCTKFPTEVILEHSEGPRTIFATIIPHKSRREPSKSTLKSFHRSMDDFAQLPDVITAAGSLMGIRGYDGKAKGPAFGQDVLRIKVTGPIGLHLSIVDLPGLIAVASEVQTEKDFAMVHDLVDSYIEKPRNIILAVVQASNDIAKQSIIKMAREFDKPGHRTVGIITKPDLINVGNEARLALLAKNADTTRLRLGFFILRTKSASYQKSGQPLHICECTLLMSPCDTTTLHWRRLMATITLRLLNFSPRVKKKSARLDCELWYTTSIALSRAACVGKDARCNLSINRIRRQQMIPRNKLIDPKLPVAESRIDRNRRRTQKGLS